MPIKNLDLLKMPDKDEAITDYDMLRAKQDALATLGLYRPLEDRMSRFLNNLQDNNKNNENLK